MFLNEDKALTISEPSLRQIIREEIERAKKEKMDEAWGRPRGDVPTLANMIHDGILDTLKAEGAWDGDARSVEILGSVDEASKLVARAVADNIRQSQGYRDLDL